MKTIVAELKNHFESIHKNVGQTKGKTAKGQVITVKKEASSSIQKKSGSFKRTFNHIFHYLARNVRAIQHKILTQNNGVLTEKGFKRAYGQLFSKDLDRGFAINLVDSLARAANSEDVTLTKLLKNNTPGLRKQLSQLIQKFSNNNKDDQFKKLAESLIESKNKLQNKL